MQSKEAPEDPPTPARRMQDIDTVLGYPTDLTVRPIAASITHFGHWIWMNQADPDLVASPLLVGWL